MFQKSEFVDPDFTALHITGVVANTDHHGLHFTQSRITHQGHLVVRMIAVISHERLRERSHAHCLGLVALLLQGGEHTHLDIEHIFLRPYSLAVFQ